MLWVAFSFFLSVSPLLGRSSRSFVRLTESLYLSSPRLTLRHNLYQVLLTSSPISFFFFKSLVFALALCSSSISSVKDSESKPTTRQTRHPNPSPSYDKIEGKETSPRIAGSRARTHAILFFCPLVDAVLCFMSLCFAFVVLCVPCLHFSPSFFWREGCLPFFYVHVVFGPYPARFIGMVVVVCFALELLSTKRVFFREI